MKREIALKILNDIRESYNKIADDFSRSRKSVWEEFKPLADYARSGDKILDLGCGNGRLAELFHGKPIEYFGLDNSQKLIEIARKKYPHQEFKLFDGLKIPFEDNYFDKIYCIAVLHHIPGRQLRQEFLEEAKRVLKPDGKLILTVFYLWQKQTYWLLLIKNTLKKIIGKSELDFFDVMEPWFKVSTRYFHVFRKGELKRAVKRCGFIIDDLSILIRGKKNKNLLVIAKK